MQWPFLTKGPHFRCSLGIMKEAASAQTNNLHFGDVECTLFTRSIGHVRWYDILFANTRRTSMATPLVGALSARLTGVYDKCNGTASLKHIQ